MCSQTDRATATATAIAERTALAQAFSAFDITRTVRATFPGENVPHGEIRTLVQGAMALAIQSGLPYTRHYDTNEGYTLYAPAGVPADSDDPNAEPDFGADDEDEGEPNDGLVLVVHRS